MDEHGLVRHRKTDRTCSICTSAITLWSMYRSNSKRSICSSCFFNPRLLRRGYLMRTLKDYSNVMYVICISAF